MSKQIIISESHVFLYHCQWMIVIDPRAKLITGENLLVLCPVFGTLGISLLLLYSLSWRSPSRVCTIHIPLYDILAALQMTALGFYCTERTSEGLCESQVKDGLCPLGRNRTSLLRMEVCVCSSSSPLEPAVLVNINEKEPPLPSSCTSVFLC